ncbi:YutD family protein [Fructilactobacillus carniphilus]|uniref:YutD family protein n=1 Tax=Fructilactobacillus carniphilus TaxID=2940297 RepID=A0ABY5BXH5_9LACO|nr:YutD family protein [Fructilactobacillus carniphilus]USS91219.1 YutD family protein [Fructilactobacillus carniphilus]
MDHSQIEDLIEQRKVERKPYAEIQRVDETTLNINGHVYTIETNVRDAFDLGEFSNRFNPIFTHYDYIVGDWGYGQLRLAGFYRDDRNVSEDLRYRTIQDYLVEVANLGTNYFIIKNLDPIVRPVGGKSGFQTNRRPREKHNKRRHPNRTRSQSRSPQSFQTGKQRRKRQFTIRQRSED